MLCCLLVRLEAAPVDIPTIVLILFFLAHSLTPPFSPLFDLYAPPPADESSQPIGVSRRRVGHAISFPLYFYFLAARYTNDLYDEQRRDP